MNRRAALALAGAALVVVGGLGGYFVYQDQQDRAARAAYQSYLDASIAADEAERGADKEARNQARWKEINNGAASADLEKIEAYQREEAAKQRAISNALADEWGRRWSRLGLRSKKRI